MSLYLTRTWRIGQRLTSTWLTKPGGWEKITVDLEPPLERSQEQLDTKAEKYSLTIPAFDFSILESNLATFGNIRIAILETMMNTIQRKKKPSNPLAKSSEPLSSSSGSNSGSDFDVFPRHVPGKTCPKKSLMDRWKALKEHWRRVKSLNPIDLILAVAFVFAQC